MVFLWILAASLIDSLLAFVGAMSLLLKKGIFEKLIFALVSFAAGTLLAGAFFHMIPESLQRIQAMSAFIIVVLGFCAFFIIERILHWHHCHKGLCNVHPVSWLILIGDGIHNFIDGAVIATSFLISVPFGIITTLIIIAHEIPQELGDFAVLVYSGFEKKRALIFNFVSQLACVFGALITYATLRTSETIFLLLPFAAGGFIYIAASDLIPELHKEENLRRSIVSFLLFLLGSGFMLMIKILT